ncbi:50S ribosomal protein L6 [Candidatus Saccharibacteria bacterium]|nr:50S ribosomal protein L6 [Candidatus Saccharibacteria bacterium]
MSRIGKLPIAIPAGVTITVPVTTAKADGEGQAIIVEGPKGKLEQFTMPAIDVKIDGDQVIVTRANDEKMVKAKHGLMRSLLNNMIVGVTAGFEKKLEINGVGFRLNSKGPQEIEMNLGFSHPVTYRAPSSVTLSVNKMEITVSGISKQQVGQVAAEIRALKKPEPYKGKGIKYIDEQIRRKAGKAGK